MADVVIAGGGIAGLAAAYELSKRGVSFVLFDRAARVGGVILSEQIDGFTIDGGPDSMLVQKPEGVRLCEELGLGGRLVPTKRPRLAYIQRGGRLHRLPEASVLGIPTRVAPFLRSQLFSWPGKIRMGAELFVPRRRDGADESIGAFMTRRFGREATTYLAEPLLAGIHAGDVDRLSVKALFPRFVDAEQKHGSLLRAFRIPNPESRIPHPEGVFRSLPGGLSEMTDALARALPAGAIRTRVLATGLRAEGSGLILTVGDGDQRVAARAVILATPAYVTSALTRSFDSELSRLCGEIPYASSAAVVLGFRRDAVAHPLNGSGFVVPRVERSGILAASWLSSKWPHRAPDDRVLMRTFIGGARDARALERSDADLVTLSLGALAPLLGIAGEPLLTRVYRWERASAQHEVGHLDRMATIERALARRPGVFVTGSGFRGVGIPDCVADARATARAVADYLQSSVPGPQSPVPGGRQS